MLRAPSCASCLRGFFLSKGRHDRRVIARADLREYGAGGGRRRERGAREDVVDAPTDVALPHVAPRWPPREDVVAIGVQLARDVDESPAENPRHEIALLRLLSDGLRLPLFLVHVAIGVRHVEIATDDEAPSARRERLGVRV